MTRGDFIVVLLAAVLVGSLYARFWQPSVAADAVEVRVGGDKVGRYRLDSPRKIDIEGRVGISVLQIEPGRVRFLSSPCRNKICVHSGWLSHAGDAAACLPNRVSITLTGHGKGALDAVSF